MALFKVKLSSFKKRTVRSTGLFVGGCLLLLVIIQLPFFSPLTEGIQSVFLKIGTSLSRVINVLGKSDTDWQTQAQNYQEIAGNLALSQTELIELRAQVNDLEKLLNYQQTTMSQGQLARVLARSSGEDGTILIDLGRDDGLSAGLAVIVEDGHLLGVVERVGASSSTVRLATDDQSRIPAAVYGDQRTIGLIEGQDGFLLRLAFVTQDQVLNVGQVVATSGLDSALPPGLILGVIESVIKEERAPFQEALIQPIYDSQFYTYVYVLDPLKTSDN